MLTRAPSVQSRISNLLAIGLMSVLGLGMLTWYYANAMTRQSHARAECPGLIERSGRRAGTCLCRVWVGSIRLLSEKPPPDPVTASGR